MKIKHFLFPLLILLIQFAKISHAEEYYVVSVVHSPGGGFSTREALRPSVESQCLGLYAPDQSDATREMIGVGCYPGASGIRYDGVKYNILKCTGDGKGDLDCDIAYMRPDGADGVLTNQFGHISILQYDSGFYLDKTVNAGKPGCGLGAGNPIQIGIGNKYLREVDIEEGVNGIPFERFYNSVSAFSRSNLGFKWSHSYSRRLYVTESDVVQAAIIERPDGKQYRFVKQSGAWVNDQAAKIKLAEIIENDERIGWELLSNDNSIEVYDNDGRLININQNGLIYSLRYSTGGLLNRIELNNGQFLELFHNEDNNIKQITNQANMSWLYEYDEMKNLIRVSSPRKLPRQVDSSKVDTSACW